MAKYIRGQNITDKLIAEVVALLDGWSSKLTWDLLLDKIEQRLSVRYTRQALHQHERIRLAFVQRKKSLSQANSAGLKSTGHPELDKALERIARLKAENERLESENNALLEQFARWAYNASSRNLSIDFLNQPLPSVDRAQTKLTRSKR
nr:hypothetical protein [Pseudomonas aeruginosa]